MSNKNENVVYTKETDMSNIQEILSKIGSALSTGNEPGGSLLNVGILNENALKKLSDAIREGVKKSKKDEESDNRERDKLTEAIDNSKFGNPRYLDEALDKFGNKLSSSIRDGIRSSMSSISRLFPLISGFTKTIVDSITSIKNTYLETYTNIYKLHEAGLNLNDHVLKIYDAAGKIGIKADTLIEVMIANSSVVAQLSGLMKSQNNNPIYELFTLSKNMSKEIGLSFNSTFNIAKDAHKDFAEQLLLTQGNLDTLTTKTETYIMFLDKLSKATGKSAESIAKETEARDKEISWKVLSMDPRNKAKIAAMTAVGFSIDQQMAILTGMPNEASVMSSLTPGYASVEKYLRETRSLNAVEIFSVIKEIANGVQPILGAQIDFFQKNPNLAFAFKDQMVGLNVMMNIMELSTERMSELDSNNKFLKSIAGLEEKINAIKNKWVKFIHIFTPIFEAVISFIDKTMDGILKLFNDDSGSTNISFDDEDFIDKIHGNMKKFVDRQLDPFFENSSNKIVKYFKDIGDYLSGDEQITPSGLYEKILKPIWDGFMEAAVFFGHNIVIGMRYAMSEMFDQMGMHRLANSFRPKEDIMGYYSNNQSIGYSNNQSIGYSNNQPNKEEKSLGSSLIDMGEWGVYGGTAGLFASGGNPLLLPATTAIMASRGIGLSNEIDNGDYVGAFEQGFKIAGGTGALKPLEKMVTNKIIQKTAAKGVAKTLLKKVPIIGAIAGLGFGIKRLYDTWDDEHADWSGFGEEILSGTLSTLPGLGTVASGMIDLHLLAKDGMNMIDQMDSTNNMQNQASGTSLNYYTPEYEQQIYDMQNQAYIAESKHREETNVSMKDICDKLGHCVVSLDEITDKLEKRRNDYEFYYN